MEAQAGGRFLLILARLVVVVANSLGALQDRLPFYRSALQGLISDAVAWLTAHGVLADRYFITPEMVGSRPSPSTSSRPSAPSSPRSPPWSWRSS